MKNLLLLLIGLLGGAILFFLGYHQITTINQTKYIQTTTSTIIDKLQTTSKLVTAKVTVSKIIESKREFTDMISGFGFESELRRLLFDDKLLMTVEGIVNAGIDLQKIGTGDVIVSLSGDQTIVQLTLPAAEIFDVYLTDKTKPFERSLGLLSKGDANLETQMRNSALESIRAEASSGTLLSTAQTNAQVIITELLQKLGGNYIITYKQ